MDESLKNRIILILAILCIILLIGNISSCANSLKHKAAFDREMFSRLVIEEKMGKYSQEKDALEKQIDEARVAAEEAEKALSEEKTIRESLEKELEKMTKLKETLEEDLKEALVNKSTKKR